MRFNDPVESVWQDVGEAEIEAPEWIVKNLIPIGVTFISGPPKSYKSAVELAALLSACGVPNPTLPPDLSECATPGRVLILSGEAMPGVLRHTAKHGLGVDIPNDMRFLALSDPWRFRLDQPNDVRDLMDWVEELDATVLAIDPLRNFHSLDENDSGGMVMMLQPVQQWAIKNKRAVIIVHHSKKLGEDKEGSKRMASANDMRGTSALFGLADGLLTITPRNSQGLIHIDAVMKRGEAWQRIIQLGIWGQSAVETISGETRLVFNMVSEGVKPSIIAASLKLPQAQVTAAVAQLKRLGALTGAGTATPQGSTLVETAVRKYAPST